MVKAPDPARTAETVPALVNPKLLAVKVPLLSVPESKVKAPFVLLSPPKSTVPAPIATLPFVAPKVPDPLKVNVPALTVVPPENVFAPDNVALPAPLLVKAPDPARIAETVPALVNPKLLAVKVPLLSVPESKVKAPLVLLSPPKSTVPAPIERLPFVAPSVPDPLKVSDHRLPIERKAEA